MNEIDLIKQPALDYDIHPLIASRWSPRAFDSRSVEPEKLKRIFEAARWSASSSNLQPWNFLVGFKNDEVYQKIFNSLVEFNQLWAVHAPILVLAIAKIINSRGEVNSSAEYDLGQAVAMLSIQAMNVGVYVHQMGGFDKEVITQELEIPDGFKVIVALTLGYRTEEDVLPPKLQKLEMSPRTRHSSTEWVFTEHFGHTADFL